MSPAEALLRKVKGNWAPPQQISTSEWADKNFYLSPEYAAEHGRWRTLSFQKEPLDTLSDPTVWQTVIRSCTQLLKTSCIQIGTAYAIDQDPGPILIVQPNGTDAVSFSKERISPMVRDIPVLKAKISKSKSRSAENTITEKWFQGGLLAVTSAGSPSNLARRAIRYLFCDEEDKWVLSAGAEGKPFSLALKRTATYRHKKKVIRCCSPTVAGSSIDKAYEDSDRREFYVPCPVCGHEQSMMLKFRAQVRWDSSLPTREEQARTARYHCEDCDAPWDDAARWDAVERGRWVAHAPFAGIAGFWISELYSPWKTLHEIVLDYLTKKDSPEDLQTFINTSLAENWTHAGEELQWRNLVQNREEYPVGIVPNGGLFLTAGADVQRADGGRIEVEVVAWGENRESWSVDKQIFYGDPSTEDVWKRLEQYVHRSFEHESGAELPIERVFIDSGDGATTRAVYEWVQRQPRPRVWACKGDRRSSQPVSGPKSVEYGSKGQKVKYGAILRTVEVDFFKGTLLADLRKRPPTDEEISKGLLYPQGYCHFPIDPVYGDEHFKQLCAERLVVSRDKRGRTKTEYEQTRPRNEALDCRVYAMAAAWDFGTHRFQPRHWDELKTRIRNQAKRNKSPQQPAAPPQPKQRPRDEKRKPWINRRPGGWL
jgi:phage terminase large subunit GpA-like protein